MPYQKKSTGLIVALDTQNLQQARQWITEIGDVADMVKVGFEFVYAVGFSVVGEISREKPLFLDLKLHDIPNTVFSAIRSLSCIKPRMLTIHASGGRAMIEAARKACDEFFPVEHRPVLLGVTVLTSLDEKGLAEIGVDQGVEAQVRRLGGLALKAGCDGLVCSAMELEMLRDAFGEKPVLVTPGIRPAGTDKGDQKRAMTPAQARQAGADWIVVGRPITQAKEKQKAAQAIVSELSL